MEDWTCFGRGGERECEHVLGSHTLFLHFSKCSFFLGSAIKDCEVPSTHTLTINSGMTGYRVLWKPTMATPLCHIWLVNQTEHEVTWTTWIPLELFFEYIRVWHPQHFLMSSCSDFYLFCQVFDSGYLEKPLWETFLGLHALVHPVHVLQEQEKKTTEMIWCGKIWLIS